MSVGLHRREALSALLASGALLLPEPATATRRPRHGGSLRLSIPLATDSLDPHDPQDLSACLLAGALFETLYTKTPSGIVYPTLARSLPQKSGSSFVVALRSGLKFASGRALSARDAIASIKRSQRLSSALAGIQAAPKSGSVDEIVFKASSAKELALLLAQGRAAILPRDFSPRTCDSCGALRVGSLNNGLLLKRNELAPRGGSLLESVRVQSTGVVDSLRRFESGHSDISLLGSGFHQARRGSLSMKLAPLGLAIVEAGPHLKQFTRPGLLHAALQNLPTTPFSSLGVNRRRQGTAAWSGTPIRILVPREEPWLRAAAEELTKTWSRPGSELRVSLINKKQIPLRRKAGDFDLMLSAISTTGASAAAITKDLFRLSKTHPPRGGRMPSPEEACRQLRVGLLGELTPKAFHRSGIRGLRGKSWLDLSDASLLRAL